MTAAERLTRKVAISLGGKSWQLLFTYGVLLEFEEVSGLDTLAGEFDPIQLSGGHLRAVLFALMARAGFAGSIADVGHLLTLRNLPEVRAAVIEAWIVSMPEPEKESAQDPDDDPAKRVESWMDAWAIASQELGISYQDWADMTPRMVRARSKVFAEGRERESLLVGVLASVTANFSFRSPKKMFTARSIMGIPELEPKKHKYYGAHLLSQLDGLPAGAVIEG
jgi:hypothetical protein